jgi:hypothetical protein
VEEEDLIAEDVVAALGQGEAVGPILPVKHPQRRQPPGMLCHHHFQATVEEAKIGDGAASLPLGVVTSCQELGDLSAAV